MSRIVLGIVGFVLFVMGIFAVWGHAAGWTISSEPVWRSWLKILVGVIILIISVSDKPSARTDH